MFRFAFKSKLCIESSFVAKKLYLAHLLGQKYKEICVLKMLDAIRISVKYSLNLHFQYLVEIQHKWVQYMLSLLPDSYK